MLRKLSWRIGAVVLAVLACAGTRPAARAGDAAEEAELRRKLEVLKQEIATIDRDRQAEVRLGSGAVERSSGMQEVVKTKEGRLTMAAFIQVYYAVTRNDNEGWADARALGSNPNVFSDNHLQDSDTFRLRRIYLRFNYAITPQVSASMAWDNTAEINSFYAQPNNQGTLTNSGWAGATPIGSTKNAGILTGSGGSDRAALEDFINFHDLDFFPNHDIQIGQFKRRMGWEGSVPSSNLDFVDRAMITQPVHVLYEQGLEVHGKWFDDRLQYWFGVWNAPGFYFQQRYNRADDNEAKDLSATLMARPLWKNETWGSLELGFSIMNGHGGAHDSRFTLSQTHQLMYPYIRYSPGGPVKGWWMGGEWGSIRDRFAPGSIITGKDILTSTSAPQNIRGWYAASGFKIGESRWKDDVNFLKNVEPTFRYEEMQNLIFANLDYPTRRLDIFPTRVYTAGLNYYIKGHNAKININYNWVREGGDSKGVRQIREVQNDNLIVQFQAGW